MRLPALCCAAALVACGGPAPESSFHEDASRSPAAVVSLGSYDAKLSETTVSGISSGGYMAEQFAVAWSSIVRGVGSVAGGPYWCAQDSVSTATSTCQIGSPSATTSINQIDSYAASGAIDATSNLARQKVWIFSGTNDGVVKRSVVNGLYSTRTHYTAASSVFYQTRLNAGHAQPTAATGNACSYTGPEFINNCGYDAAGLLLQHLYGKLNAKASSQTGQLIAFDQNAFTPTDAWDYSLSHTGYVYVPSSCASGGHCRVHVAFHGCKQNTDYVGTDYIRSAGYNEWADTNNLIILYPQTVASSGAPYNPNGCWDWWGYNESGYATKSGSQIQAVRAMLTRLTGGYSGWSAAPGGTFGAPSGLSASDASNTRIDLVWLGVAGASSYAVYRAACSTCTFSQIGSTTSPSYSDSGLTASTSYAYKVRAVNGSGTQSSDSAIVTRSTGATPAACDPYFRDNYTHTTEGRAYALYGYAYAYGSNDYLGLWNIYTETNLIQTSSGYFRAATCP